MLNRRQRLLVVHAVQHRCDRDRALWVPRPQGIHLGGAESRRLGQDQQIGDDRRTPAGRLLGDRDGNGDAPGAAEEVGQHLPATGFRFHDEMIGGDVFAEPMRVTPLRVVLMPFSSACTWVG